MALATSSLFVPGSQVLPPAPAAAYLGGKGAGLLRLRALGLPVPAFVVLPVALFEPALVGLPTSAAGLAERRGRLSCFEVPAATRAALAAVLVAWNFPAQPVAVRSSVADEDGAAAAFPGMMDSVLNVSDWPALWAAVARVAASAYSDRAVAYRRQRGLPLAARPAVVVQRQVAARAAARQAEFAAYRAAPAPAGRLVVPARPMAAAEVPPPADGYLRGTGCYPGQVRGEVVVITDPAQADIGAVRGRIVAALRTDPGWAALFPGCRAVLIERGSALSHSVILLRELGIPTIINVPGLTAHLRSGQLVQADGRTGEIALII